MNSTPRPIACAIQHPIDRFRQVRQETVALIGPLSAEDCQVQSMPDASPAKWHLAHTSWFFETFLLLTLADDYLPFDPAFSTLFNSYYMSIGPQHPRPERGLLTRPSLDRVIAYRTHVDNAMVRLMLNAPPSTWQAMLELGLQHEQQHQELLLMDIQHLLSRNPLEPAYATAPLSACHVNAMEWRAISPGLYYIGHEGNGFAFDNEMPRHRIWLDSCAIADRLVTAGEYLCFIEDGGYQRPELWLSDGWASVKNEGWNAPLYWQSGAGGWSRFSLHGRHAIMAHEPVCHVSYYEADAFARWAKARLPTEAEWEVAASRGLLQQTGSAVWQWTASAYAPYPGFAPAAGAIGEYNGKFMINQMVLRGGSHATPPGHARPTYRNFFPPAARWVFSGIRLAHSSTPD